MARHGGRRKKRKTHLTPEVDSDVPRLFIIRRGALSPDLKQLEIDLRHLFSPNCASKLKEGSKQKLKDFTSVVDILGLSHILTISQGGTSANIRIAKFPQGPTLCFAIDSYSLTSDITKHAESPQSLGMHANYSPLLVLHGFPKVDEQDPLQSVTATLNELFAPIDVATSKIQLCKRVVLFHYHKDKKQISIRHYLINLVDIYTQETVKHLLDNKLLKRLNEYKGFQDLDIDCVNDNKKNKDGVDVSHLDPVAIVHKQKYNVETIVDELDGNGKIEIKLVEVGPRVDMTLIKIQQGAFDGPITYHKYVNKTPIEIQELESKAEKRTSLQL